MPRARRRTPRVTASPPRTSTGRRSVLVAVASCTLLLASCTTNAPAPGPSATRSSGPASYAPVTLDNCGTEVTFDAPPQRVVAIKSSTTEMLLALGLADTLVGTAFADGPLPERWADDAADVPVLSDKVPGQEALLEVEPDLVYAGWESNLSADGAGERSTLGALGIATYVSPSACKEPGYQPDPLTFDDVLHEIREVGDVFGVPDAAAEVVAEQQATLDAIEPADGQTAVWWSSGTDTPYVGAGIGAPQMLLETAGLTNVFADVHDTWTSVGWEQVVSADPDVLVLVDSAWNSAQKKKDFLAAHPAASQLTAVREQRYVVVPFAASEAGVRNAQAAADLAEAARALDMGTPVPDPTTQG
ncbi:putative F420-0 ABC transporter substrate-binding protein [Cellulomonas xiejunii]|uniref:putative F420-0 ABC transporter substrate-binding protein n=1 Tax=Cellulomonas xiejunii TaxID=2968083 RepID=UPI001D0DCA05|nr:putative F420-0 ABC transporter substrate-binding protein [Cellulomonas xiejunii]MCC2315318.1 putative F420-0 ABC transporter substrate-binding protein [Cellulomonas xiejunii]